MSVVFLGAAAVLLIGLFAVIMMKEVPLRTMSGVDAQRADNARTPAPLSPGTAPAAVPAEALVPDPAAERLR